MTRNLWQSRTNLPGALSPAEKKTEVGKGGEIPPVAKSSGPHSNALAYRKRALLT